MADDKKTYSEDEHIAILADRVTKETASLTAERDQLSTDKSDLETKLDVAESAKTAAEQKAEESEKALADYKAEVETAREEAARKDTRIAKVKETASHLGDEFFEDEKRVQRIVAMDDEGFEGYLADLQATAKVPAGGTTKTIPRETAMAGAGADATTDQSASRSFLLQRYIAPQEG